MVSLDSKGRISIPIGLRAKLGLLEGSKVRIVLNKGRLIITPIQSGTNVQSSVKVSTEDCESSSSSSSPDSGLKKR